MTPAGAQAPVKGDMPLKIIVSPDGKTLAATLGGYSNMGLTLVNIVGKRKRSFCRSSAA